jgi:hypothetical protein
MQGKKTSANDILGKHAAPNLRTSSSLFWGETASKIYSKMSSRIAIQSSTSSSHSTQA